MTKTGGDLDAFKNLPGKISGWQKGRETGREKNQHTSKGKRKKGPILEIGPSPGRQKNYTCKGRESIQSVGDTSHYGGGAIIQVEIKNFLP